MARLSFLTQRLRRKWRQGGASQAQSTLVSPEGEIRHLIWLFWVFFFWKLQEKWFRWWCIFCGSERQLFLLRRLPSALIVNKYTHVHQRHTHRLTTTILFINSGAPSYPCSAYGVKALPWCQHQGRWSLSDPWLAPPGTGSVYLGSRLKDYMISHRHHPAVRIIYIRQHPVVSDSYLREHVSTTSHNPVDIFQRKSHAVK